MATKAKPKPIGVNGTKPGFLKSSAEIAMETIQRDLAQEEADARRAAEAMKAAYNPEMAETVVVSRIALEGMAARAGLSVTWRHGEPYFNETISLNDLSPREREVEKRCRQLEAENTRLRDQLKSAVRRDDKFADEVKRQADEVKREKELKEAAKRREAEAQAVKDILDKGASIADVKALEDLLGVSGVDLRDTVVRPPQRQQPGTPTPKRNEVLFNGQPLGPSVIQQASQQLLEQSNKQFEDMIRAKLMSYDQAMGALGVTGPEIAEVKQDVSGNLTVGWKARIGGIFKQDEEQK